MKLKNSLAKKSAKLFRKMTLTAAFAGATACGGRIHPDYGVGLDFKTKPEACAPTSNIEELRQQVPQLGQSINLMGQLPLTGAQISDMLIDPSNRIESCVFHVDDGKGSTNFYQHRRVMVASNVGTSVSFHEYFHATQDIGGYIAYNYLYLTERDAVVGNFLTEAAAVAFELAARQEAENLGLQFTVTNAKDRAEDPVIQDVFTQAYTKHLNESTISDPDMQEAKALEFAGKEIVRYLLGANDTEWQKVYVAVSSADAKRIVVDDGRELRLDYDDMRQKIYFLRGILSENINVIPDEFLGPDAKKYIDTSFDKMGLKESVLRKVLRIFKGTKGPKPDFQRLKYQ